MRLSVLFSFLAILIFLVSLIGSVDRLENSANVKLSTGTYFFRIIADKAEGVLRPFFRLKNLEQENYFLVQENKRLLGLILSSRSGNQLNQGNFLSADVISFDPQIPGVILINKGLGDKIDDGHLVIDENFLVVGTTYNSSQNSAKVKTIYSQDLAFNVTDFNGSLLGAAVSKGLSGVEVNFVDPNLGVQDNDYVLTAGNDSVFPPGFLVGRIARQEKQGAFVKLIVKPLINIGNLNRVFIKK